MKGSRKYKKRLKEIVWTKLRPMFRQAAINLLMDAMVSKEHGDLTGNTLTSFACGIYNKGKLKDTILLIDVASLDQPTFRKLSDTDGVIEIERYDTGYVATVNTKGMQRTDKKYGYDTAQKFLRGYKPDNVDGISLVMTTGTEYSQYIEDVRKLNVLTETKLSVGGLVNGVFRV